MQEKIGLMLWFITLKPSMSLLLLHVCCYRFVSDMLFEVIVKLK